MSWKNNYALIRKDQKEFGFNEANLKLTISEYVEKIKCFIK